MKLKLFMFATALFITHSVFAMKAQDCPSVGALNSVGVINPIALGDIWFVSNVNHYDTTEEWTFGIFVPASDENDAIEQANAAISSLYQAGEPDSNQQQTVCMYRSSQNQNLPMGMAVTPPMDMGSVIKSVMPKLSSLK